MAAERPPCSVVLEGGITSAVSYARGATPVPLLLDILSTALNWRDSLQRRLPGFRERMLHAGLPSDTGGLHLAIKRTTILMLAGLGVDAMNQDTPEPQPELHLSPPW